MGKLNEPIHKGKRYKITNYEILTVKLNLQEKDYYKSKPIIDGWILSETWRRANSNHKTRPVGSAREGATAHLNPSISQKKTRRSKII